MLSGYSESGLGNSASAPVKPWEVPNAFPPSNSLFSNAFAPPPPPIPDPASQSNVGFLSGYPGYTNNRYSYPLNYNNSGFNSHSYQSYYGNNIPFGPPAPGSYITSSLENSTRPLFDSINQILQAINQFACFIDSTVFAVWTSFAAAGNIVSIIKNIKNIYLLQLTKIIKKSIQDIKLSLRSASGRKKFLLLIAVLGSIPILLKALSIILRLENDSETALVSAGPINEDNSTEYIASKALFVRSLYSFDHPDGEMYLKLKPGDVILISKDDESKLNNANPVWIAGKLKNESTGLFPSNYARIKKIMQLDNEIGKVALATPILISKALEVFMQNLVDESCKRVQNSGLTKFDPVFLKQCINETEEFDFLKDIVSNVENPSNTNSSVAQSSEEIKIVLGTEEVVTDSCEIEETTVDKLPHNRNSINNILNEDPVTPILVRSNDFESKSQDIDNYEDNLDKIPE